MRRLAVFMGLVLTVAQITLARGQDIPAGHPTAKLRSATEFLSPEMKAEQADDFRNRGMLWVEQGERLFAQPPPGNGPACASCHGEGGTSLRGVAARLPAVDTASGQLVNLEGRINKCRQTRQSLPPLAYESEELLALTAHLSHQSKGEPLAVPTDGPAAPFHEQGQKLWNERQGQLNLACSQCHDQSVGKKLRGDTISSAVPTGYPAYRLEWQTIGSLHRRLRACQLGVRAELFELGSPQYLALELFLKARARQHPIDAPALRR